MTHLDLFSGIGAFPLAAQRLGWTTIGMCEIDDFCRKVLKKNFPGVPVIHDVRWLAKHADRLRGRVDVLSGGFPCQDVSDAGRRAGIDGARSGMWREMVRVIRGIRPQYVVVENVPGLLRRGMGRVLGDLAECGYDAEWQVMGADDLGASQHRKRVWILAYPHDERLQGPIWAGKPQAPRETRTTAHCEPLRSNCGYWPPGPRKVNDIPRMADGPTNRMDRLISLGNSAVPDCCVAVFRAIADADSPTEHGYSDAKSGRLSI